METAIKGKISNTGGMLTAEASSVSQQDPQHQYAAPAAHMRHPWQQHSTPSLLVHLLFLLVSALPAILAPPATMVEPQTRDGEPGSGCPCRCPSRICQNRAPIPQGKIPSCQTCGASSLPETSMHTAAHGQEALTPQCVPLSQGS